MTFTWLDYDCRTKAKTSSLTIPVSSSADLHRLWVETCSDCASHQAARTTIIPHITNIYHMQTDNVWTLCYHNLEKIEQNFKKSRHNNFLILHTRLFYQVSQTPSLF